MTSYSKQVPVHAIKTKEMDALGFGIINLLDNAGKVYDSDVPHRHTFFELLFFTKAHGKHEIDFGHYPVKSNSVHFVSPGQIHKLHLKKNNGYVLCFSEDFVNLKSKERIVDSFPYYNTSNYPVLQLTKQFGLELEELIKSIYLEYKKGETSSVDICKSYLTIILLKLKACYSESLESHKQNTSDKHQKVTQFKKLIHENYLSHKTVSDYAEELFVSPNHLNALCKKEEGKTATQLIQDRLLLEAKRLLYATDMQIKEISFLLHFEDVPYFNRFFKKQTKVTPNEYRQQVFKNR